MRLFWILVISLGLVSCAGSTLEQDGGNLTRSEVEFLSAKMVDAVEENYPALKHKGVNRYVSSLGQSIISRNKDLPPLPYEFRVLRSNDIFLFSLPGGIIYLSLGLLRFVEFEGQLASAIAHELSHQQLNHYLILWRKKVNANRERAYLLDFKTSFQESFLGTGAAIDLSDGMEEEADQLAPVILFRAKYDPRSYLSFLQSVKKQQNANLKSIELITKLHPPIEKRIEWARQSLLKIPPQKDASISSSSFQQIKAILAKTAKIGEEKEER
jgi:predicted Zn-dependent protease